VESELKTLEVEKAVNLVLIDTLYDTKAAVNFNDVKSDSIEFRYYLDQIIDT